MSAADAAMINPADVGWMSLDRLGALPGRQPHDERDRVRDGEERGRPANRPVAGVAQSADQRDRDRDDRQQGERGRVL